MNSPAKRHFKLFKGMTLVVFAIHTLCEFVHCVFVCVSTVQCFGTCDLPGAFLG